MSCSMIVATRFIVQNSLIFQNICAINGTATILWYLTVAARFIVRDFSRTNKRIQVILKGGYDVCPTR